MLATFFLGRPAQRIVLDGISKICLFAVSAYFQQPRHSLGTEWPATQPQLDALNSGFCHGRVDVS
jgi:hypothetical protein